MAVDVKICKNEEDWSDRISDCYGLDGWMAKWLNWLVMSREKDYLKTELLL